MHTVGDMHPARRKGEENYQGTRQAQSAISPGRRRGEPNHKAWKKFQVLNLVSEPEGERREAIARARTASPILSSSPASSAIPSLKASSFSSASGSISPVSPISPVASVLTAEGAAALQSSFAKSSASSASSARIDGVTAAGMQGSSSPATGIAGEGRELGGAGSAALRDASSSGAENPDASVSAEDAAAMIGALSEGLASLHNVIEALPDLARLLRLLAERELSVPSNPSGHNRRASDRANDRAPSRQQGRDWTIDDAVEIHNLCSETRRTGRNLPQATSRYQTRQRTDDEDILPPNFLFGRRFD